MAAGGIDQTVSVEGPDLDRIGHPATAVVDAPDSPVGEAELASAVAIEIYPRSGERVAPVMRQQAIMRSRLGAIGRLTGRHFRCDRDLR